MHARHHRIARNARRTFCAWAQAQGADDDEWITLFGYGSDASRRFDLNYRRMTDAGSFAMASKITIFMLRDPRIAIGSTTETFTTSASPTTATHCSSTSTANIAAEIWKSSRYRSEQLDLGWSRSRESGQRHNFRLGWRHLYRLDFRQGLSPSLVKTLYLRLMRGKAPFVTGKPHSEKR